MIRSLRSVSALVMILMSLACSHTPQPSTTAASPVKVAETKAALRDLWLGHVLGIRNMAVATMIRIQQPGMPPKRP